MNLTMLSLYLGLFYGKKVEFKGYRSKGKHFPNATVTALKGKVSWGQELRISHTKSHHTTNSYKRFIGRNTRG